MLIVNDPSKAHLTRTLRGLYQWTQATPKDVFLDPEWDRSVDIYPGMVAGKGPGNTFTLLSEDAPDAIGLIGLFIGGDGIDEIVGTGVNAGAVWALGPDAEFEVLAPAFDNSATWEEAAGGATTLVYASTSGANQGKLVPEGGANASATPVARLLHVAGPNKIVIGGLRPQDA